MNLSRRGFFGATVGAVLGGRKAAEAAAMELAGVGGIGSAAAAMADVVSIAPSGGGPGSGSDRVLSRTAMRLLGLPPGMRERWKQQADQVRVLDPDLAANRAFSLSAKIIIQRQRNMDRIERDFWEGPTWSATQRWLTSHGFDYFES